MRDKGEKEKKKQRKNREKKGGVERNNNNKNHLNKMCDLNIGRDTNAEFGFFSSNTEV